MKTTLLALITASLVALTAGCTSSSTNSSIRLAKFNAVSHGHIKDRADLRATNIALAQAHR